ncbi:GumC family protein [Jannaschia donghaensis]|uniref:Polysaccharide chain length determinant protein, PEP-CTERM locus subfamily n=1 Tax=Jannaschia donghaensis TaxID=420998 RepID=A0A0M6YIK3_9RHOB|nr:Wzz/FepE/Etk N-terminal domain-containing protein [Jannaschia donghaensis]CTQ49343.1 polysaccharide chain length determinant protein, PEP-CTERM locus subfamily [Jannaschia donghaensis]
MMNEIRFYGSLFRRRLGWFLLTVMVLTGTGLAVAVSLPPVYAAKARLVVESEKIPDELAASTVQTQALEHLQIIQQRLLSRENLLDMANRLQVYGSDRPAPDQVVSDMRKRITLDITGGQPRPRDPVKATILLVGFEADTAVMSAAVANELVTRVMAEDVDMRTTVARQTLEFFDQEVSRLNQQLSQSGAVLLSFQQENQDLLPATRDLRQTRLAAIEAELSRIDRDTGDMRRERERLTRLHESVRRREGRPDIGYEARQIAALRETLSNLPADDPGADEIARRIDALSRRLDATGGTEVGRTAYHRHRDEIDARIAEEDARRIALIDELERLRTGLALAPVKSAELASLERDHNNLQSLYEQALDAKALAETGDAIESLSKGQRIGIVEQASIPRVPDRPNRKLVAAAGAAGGIFVGLLVVILLELRLGFLRRPVDLERRLGITPIATLPIIDDSRPKPIRAGRSLQRKLCVGVAALIAVAVAGGIVSGYLPAPSEIAARLTSTDVL